MSKEKKGFFGRLAEGLAKTRNHIVSGMDLIFSGFSDINDAFYEEIEEILIMGDLGVSATEEIIEGKSKRTKNQRTRILQAAIDREYQRADAGGRDGVPF